MAKTVNNQESGQASPKAAPACNAVALRAGCGGQASPKARYCGGQATVEYTIVTGVLITLVLIMGLFLTTFGDYGERLLSIFASDYP